MNKDFAGFEASYDDTGLQPILGSNRVEIKASDDFDQVAQDE